MKKRLFTFIMVSFLSLLTISCQKENVADKQQAVQKRSNKEGVIRLSSTNSLSEIINSMKDADNFNVKGLIKTKSSGSEFDESFISLRESLIEELMLQFSESERQEIQREELLYEPEDSLITDPYYAAILNENREIQIENKIYRYIEEGLLVYDYDPENQFIPESIENLPMVQEGEHAMVMDGNGNCGELYGMSYGHGPKPGIIGDEIIDDEPDPDPTPGPGDNNDNENGYEPLVLMSGEAMSSSDTKKAIYEKWEGSGSWLQKGISSCFGTSVSITNHFDSKHRMKLRMYSQDYFIYRSSGMTVRMQKKKLGIWWRTKAQEFRYGWSPIELQFKYNSVKVPEPPKNGQQSPEYPVGMSKKFPFSNANIELFHIPLVNYDVTTGNLNSLYKSAVKKALNVIRNWFSDPQAEQRYKHRIGFYTADGENFIILLPQGEESSIGHGRDVVRFNIDLFSGIFRLGFKIGIGTGSFRFDNANISTTGKVEIVRGRVYAAVKYNNQWKACEIRTE